tara:strand:+ start:260 stop:484 length:225 start_codon:yes stop_codon:yes gene_type:complete
MTMQEVDENQREMRRKIAMEKNMLNQMGCLEGCLTQFDRLRKIQQLYRSGNVLQKQGKKRQQMAIDRRRRKFMD